MSRRKQRSALAQVFEFCRGRIVAYRDIYIVDYLAGKSVVVLDETKQLWSSSSQFKRTPVMLLNSNGREQGQCPFCNRTMCHRWIDVQDDSAHILFKNIKQDSSRRFTSVDASLQCMMDQIDTFPDTFQRPGSNPVPLKPVTLPENQTHFGVVLICRSADHGTSPCLHHLSGTQHETSFCLVLQRQLVSK
ncbi:hypothetical protein TNCV_755931 [Trichonephila clavipes]|nr:hypothetical protein TNCV_755931 [Trichonephila clavipes]